jgi:hypothetical protein
MLAGPESVDAVIDATAGIGEAVEAADLDRVEAAAPGLRAKRAEKGCAGSISSTATISVEPRQRRNSISCLSVVSQPSGGGGRSSTARALRRAPPFPSAPGRSGACAVLESADRNMTGH